MLEADKKVTKEMVIDRLNVTKEKAEKTLNDLRSTGDPLDYDTIAALEETIDLTARLIVTMPWDKLSQDELRKWFELTQREDRGRFEHKNDQK